MRFVIAIYAIHGVVHICTGDWVLALYDFVISMAFFMIVGLTKRLEETVAVWVKLESFWEIRSTPRRISSALVTTSFQRSARRRFKMKSCEM